MDAFGWSTQYAAEPCLPSRPSDDDGLLSAFMCTSFRDGLHHSDHGSLDMSSSQTIPNLVRFHDGTSLSDSVPAAFMGLDTAADMLPSGGGAVDDDLFDAFAYVPNVAEGAARAAASNSNTVFSGYSSTTAGNGGNISSGESNTYGGGQDIEVASPCAAVSRPTLLHQAPTLPPSKRKLDKNPASCSSVTTAVAKRAAVSSSSTTTSITFGGQRHHHQASGTTLLGTNGYEHDAEALAQVKEMIYRAAAMRPVHQLLRAAAAGEPPSHQNKPRRKNVRISSDPQTVAARLRRERVSERLRVLQRLVPGGSRMDTASMLDEAASYLKFLKSQLEALESAGNPSNGSGGYCNGTSLQQNYYMGNNLGGGTSGGSTVLAFGSRDGIGGYVKSNRTMPL